MLGIMVALGLGRLLGLYLATPAPFKPTLKFFLSLYSLDYCYWILVFIIRLLDEAELFIAPSPLFVMPPFRF